MVCLDSLFMVGGEGLSKNVCQKIEKKELAKTP